ncbi:hypothetical protein CEE36_02480 [candidate division TA06 bacterium B3_TA06]|uniref:HEAT repeat domain-containing protein n=1 Tax=candidate division TA06 bacterium B3_TA06 TaxID=2012487 RepID=A0A532V9Z4_UNCT6|nr:MAG: hypothetical protein CEE36_02480 [candidate division TA06 bacterium B3_TA06]
MATVVVFGIEVDERCAEYLQLVVKYARSGDSDARQVRRRALKNLGRNHCRRALIYLIDRYAKSGDSDEREVRSMAFEYLEMIDEGEL